MYRIFTLFCMLQVGCVSERGVVAGTRVPCQAEGLFTCLQLDGELIFGGIEGFTHRWGVETEIDYTVETIADPPQDSSSRRYILDRIVDERPGTATTFDLAFPAVAPGNDTWFRGSSSPLDMVGTAVECEAAICADIMARGITAFGVTLELTADPQRLRAVAVQ